jgi:hypothetical protein
MNKNSCNKLNLDISSKSSSFISNSKLNSNSHSAQYLFCNQVKQISTGESKSDNNYSFDSDSTFAEDVVKKRNSPNKKDRFKLKNLLTFSSFKLQEDSIEKETNAKKSSQNDVQLKKNKECKKKLTHQALSLSSGFTTLSNTNNYSPKLVPIDCITDNLRLSQFYFSLDKNGSNDKLKVENETEMPNQRLLFTQPGILFRRRDGTDQKSIFSYKEYINQRNVRRKSSTIQAGCFVSNLLENSNGVCNKSKEIRNNLSIKNNNSKEKIERNLINKALKRGSIHFKPKVNTDIGVSVGVNDMKLRKKLLKLQQEQQNFKHASSSFLSIGVERRKMAFVAESLNLTDVEGYFKSNNSDKEVALEATNATNTFLNISRADAISLLVS